LPAVAISMASTEPVFLETAAYVAVALLKQIQKQPLTRDSILNVNVPDVPLDQLKGFQATRLGQRHKSEPVIKTLDPRGRRIYWVGPPGPEQDAGPGTDFFAVKNHYVSVTPLQLDLTRYEKLDTLTAWLPQVGER
ncbi:MAG: 5'/3'-nucleotidase SurE, partial [Gammaproteobacteria bacterium]